MSKNTQTTEVQESAIRDYGVCEAVPQEGRHYGFWDMTSTWVGANAQPGTWALGGALAGSGMLVALSTTLIVNPISYIFLALMGFIGYKVATNAMGLTRFSMGIRASKLIALLNTLTMLGWGIVGNYVAAISLSYMFNAAFGMPCYGMEGSTGTMVLGVFICAILTNLLLWCGGGKTIKIAERVGVVLMIAFSIWMTIKIFSTYDFKAIFDWQPPEGAGMTTGGAIDYIAAFSFSWIPCAADYTRYCKTKKSATLAPIVGATVGIYWFALVGCIGTIAAVATGVFDPNASDPSSIAMNLGLGIPAFVVVLFSTVTTNVVSLYSSVCSNMNFVREDFSFKKMGYIMGILTLAISLIGPFLGGFLDVFYMLLDYLGLVFPALISVMLVDYYLIRKSYSMSEIDKKGGAYWFSGGVNWVAVVCWIIGMICFYLFKTMAFASTISATVPTVIISALVYYVTAKAAMSKGYYRKPSE